MNAERREDMVGCASKEKNTDVAWGVAWEPGHNSIYHHT